MNEPLTFTQVPTQRLFGTKDAAHYLGFHEDTLRKYAALGVIPAHRLGNRRVFRLDDLDAFIESLPEHTATGYTVGGGKPGGKEAKNGS